MAKKALLIGENLPNNLPVRIVHDHIDADIVITDTKSCKYVPENLPVYVIGSGGIDDWAVKQKYPNYKILKFEDLIEELIKKDTEKIDTLTGLATREALNTFIKNNPKCIFAILDLDFFKQVNDNYGHMAGDSVLKAFSAFIKDQADLTIRWGGEEFLMVFKSSIEEAFIKVEELRQGWEKTVIQSEGEISHQIKTTFSAGIAEYEGVINEAIGKADQEMYKAKESGRNKILPDFKECISDNEALKETIKKGVLLLSTANKGGVGKTTSAISIAKAIADKGFKTIMMDFDYGGENVATFFSLKREKAPDYLLGERTKETIAKSIKKVQSNLYVLQRPPSTLAPSITAEMLEDIVEILSEDFQVIVGDTPQQPATKTNLYGLFKKADIVYYICTQEKSSVEEAKLYGPSVVRMGTKPANIRLIVNKYSSKVKVPVSEIEKSFLSGFKKEFKKEIKTAGIIPAAHDEYIKAGWKGMVMNEEIWADVTSEVYTLLTGKEEVKSDGTKRKNIFYSFLGRLGLF